MEPLIVSLVSAKWMPCSLCGSTYVLVVPEHDAEILCNECIVEGVRDSFWLEVDDHELPAVALITCRDCGVHHVIPRNVTTLGAVLALAQGHKCSER